MASIDRPRSSDQPRPDDRPRSSDQPRPDDRPRQTDQPAPARWYDQHAANERALERRMESARRRFGPASTPAELRAWVYKNDKDYSDTPSDQRPAPFKPEKAREVPDYGGNRTSGLLDLNTDEDIEITSGHKGGEIMHRFKERNGGQLPAQYGFQEQISHHVEAQAAAQMRMSDCADATLYINQKPCIRRASGCDRILPAMLPPGAYLTVFGPGEFVKVYRGLPDEGAGR